MTSTTSPSARVYTGEPQDVTKSSPGWVSVASAELLATSKTSFGPDPTFLTSVPCRNSPRHAPGTTAFTKPLHPAEEDGTDDWCTSEGAADNLSVNRSSASVSA